MTTILQKGIQDAALYNQSRTMGPGVATALSKFVPPTTTAAFGAYYNNNSNQMGSFFSNTIPNTFKAPITPVKLLVYAILSLIVVTLILVTYNYIVSTRPKPISVDTAAATAGATATSLQGFENPEPVPSNGPIVSNLINMQPKTLAQAAYLGYGIFDANAGIMQQLRLGARTIMLQIDYVDIQSVEGATPYMPCLLMRNNSGFLTSKNAAPLNDVMNYINQYAFNDTFPNHTEPLILLLHFVKLPYAISDTVKYVEYLTNVARSISKLNRYLLSGGYYRSGKETDIFHSGIDELHEKIVIGTNIDTSFFNRVHVESNLDLDYLTNFHYYVKDTEHVDATIITPETSYNAIIYNINTLLNMDSAQKDIWIQRNKTKFTIVKPNNESNPTPDQVSRLLNEFGVNCIPYDFFGEPNATSRATVNSMYGGSHRMRPAILQV